MSADTCKRADKDQYLSDTTFLTVSDQRSKNPLTDTLAKSLILKDPDSVLSPFLNHMILEPMRSQWF